MMKNRIVMLAATVIVFFSFNASAADNEGYYLSASVGQARGGFDQAQGDATFKSIPGVTSVSSTVNDSPSSLKVEGGYQVNSNFAVEAGYVDIAKYTYDATIQPGTIKVSLAGKISLFKFDAVGILPINDIFSTFGKLGFAMVKADDTGSVNSAAVTPSNTSTSSYTFGFGLKANINKGLFVTLDVENYDPGEDFSGRFGMWSLGAGYKF